jgi:hypothetical protein
MYFRWTLSRHNDDNLLSDIVERNHVFTRLIVLNERSTVHVVAGRVIIIRMACRMLDRSPFTAIGHIATFLWCLMIALSTSGTKPWIHRLSCQCHRVAALSQLIHKNRRTHSWRYWQNLNRHSKVDGSCSICENISKNVTSDSSLCTLISLVRSMTCFWTFRKSIDFYCNTWRIGSKIAQYLAMIARATRSLEFVIAVWSWWASCRVWLVALFEKSSSACTISSIYEMKTRIVLYLAVHRVFGIADRRIALFEKFEGRLLRSNCV